MFSSLRLLRFSAAPVLILRNGPNFSTGSSISAAILIFNTGRSISAASVSILSSGCFDLSEMQGVASVLIELTQEVQELEESITNKVHHLISRMTAAEHVQDAEQHLQRLEESVEGIRGLVEGVRMKLTEVGGSRELVLVTQETVLCQQHQQEQQQQQQVLQWHPEDQQQEKSQRQQQQPQQQLLKQLECQSCQVRIPRGGHGSSLTGAKRRMRTMDAQLQQQIVKVQRIERGLQSLATFHSTQLLKGFTTLDLSALPSPSYHTLVFHLLSLSLHHSASLSTVSTLKAYPSITTPCLQQIIVLNLPALKKLDLSNCTRLVDSDLPLIARFTQLTHLCLAGCTGFRFGAAAPYPVTSSAPNLANLTDFANLTNLASLTNLANLTSLTNLTKLRRLNLSRTAVGDEGMAVWCQLTGITILDLRHCARITCRAMYHICQLQHLDTLNLAWVAHSAAGFAANSAGYSDSVPGE
ncbi:unnamed protein product, partial [Closterium sp. NIES-54]